MKKFYLYELEKMLDILGIVINRVILDDEKTTLSEPEGISTNTEFGAPGVPHPEISVAECQLSRLSESIPGIVFSRATPSSPANNE